MSRQYINNNGDDKKLDPIFDLKEIWISVHTIFHCQQQEE